MPRIAAVSVEDAIKVIVQFGTHFGSQKLPIWSSNVWQEMSLALGKKWTPHCVYTNVTENRRSILDRAREEMNIVIVNIDENNNTSFDRTVEKLSTCDESSSSKVSFESDSEKKKKRNVEIFDLILTEQEWRDIKPDSDKAGKIKLKPGQWTNVVAIAMWLQFRMPCAFVFKQGEVSLSDDGKTYIIRITGKCKSSDCGNTFDGYAVKEVGLKGLTIQVSTRDTRFGRHDVIKRPLNGERRKAARKSLRSEGGAVWRKRQARKCMLPGDVDPPILPSSDVLRQARQEGVDADLSIKKSDARDLIRTLEEMALKPEYCGIIHSVGSLPFYLFYCAPAQLYAYKEYYRLNRRSCCICIDATGSVVKSLNRSNGTKIGHVFLYPIVINFENTTIAIYQMLSEQHDTEFIEFWLKRWLRMGAPKPKKVVCDYSRALLSALSLAFNNQTVKAYITTCFNTVSRSNIGLCQKPATLIRVDVAHLIHLISRWKCFEVLKHVTIKEFFMRCIALMVECTIYSNFEEIFSLTCTVGVQTHEDSQLNILGAKTPKEARKKLENLISTGGIQIDFDIESPTNNRVKDCPEIFELNDLDELDRCSGTDICDWINQQVSEATETRNPGQELNPFYLPDFIKSLAKLCRKFPIWTRVGFDYCKGRATSSYVESSFNDVKTRVLKNASKPLRVDKFVKIHARDIAGATLLFSSKLVQANVHRCEDLNAQCDTVKDVSSNSKIQSAAIKSSGSYLIPIEDLNGLKNAELDIDDSDLISIENWHGKAKVPSIQTTISFGQPLENSIDLDLDSNLPCSTRLDNNYSDDNHNMVLADHSISETEELPALEIPIADAYGELSVVPITNSPSKKQLHEPSGGKLKVHLETVKTSKYFKPYPEVRQMNAHPTANKKVVLLANGLCCPAVRMNEESFFVVRTCSFDSLAQILLTAAIDDVEYFTFIKSSTNSMLQLVLQLIQTGVTHKIYSERMVILRQFCPSTVQLSTEKRVLSYLIDGELNIAHLVEEVMKSEPSVHNIEDCSHCGRRTYSSIVIAPNHQLIGRRGFSSLERALDFQSAIYNIRCRNQCLGKYTLLRRSNKHVFVELDIRPKLEATCGLKCKVKEVPSILHLRQSEQMTYEYRLVGVVAYTPGHYTAYCVRKNGIWELYNDLTKEINKCNLSTNIEAHLAVYVRTSK